MERINKSRETMPQKTQRAWVGASISRQPTHPALVQQRVKDAPFCMINRDDIMVLQRTIGNRAVGQRLQARMEEQEAVQRQEAPCPECPPQEMKQGKPPVIHGMIQRNVVPPPRETRAQKIARFNTWHARERRTMGWISALPPCPCRLRVTSGLLWGTNAENPNPAIWNDPTSWLWGYHQGATWCMRSRTPTATGSGEQACYDASGQLITHGSGAGSADRISPDHDFWGHQTADVKPANLARELDGGSFGAFSRRYLEVRPPNNKLSCPRNP